MARAAALLLACYVCGASAAADQNAWSLRGHRQPAASNSTAAPNVLQQGQRMLATVQMPQKAVGALHSLLSRIGQSLVVVSTKMQEANQELVDSVKSDTNLDHFAMKINTTIFKAQAAYKDFEQEFRDSLYPFGKTLNEVKTVVPDFPTDGAKANEKINHVLMEAFIEPFQEGMDRFRSFTDGFDKLPQDQKLKIIREINTGLDAGIEEQKLLLKMPAMDMDKAMARGLGMLPDEMSEQVKSTRRWMALLPRQNLNNLRSLGDAMHTASATLGIKWGYGPEFTEGARVETKEQAEIPQKIAAHNAKQNLAAMKTVFGILRRKMSQ